MLSFQIPPDGGMLYTETNMQHLFPEPLNAITSVFFIAIALYWSFKLRGKYKHHAFLSVAVCMLYIGGIGGTIYHGLRQWSFFIIMDWLPIMLLCVAAGVYFLTRIIKWYYALALAAAYICFLGFIRNSSFAYENTQLFININYAVLAGMVLVPVFLFLWISKFRYAIWVSIALIAFITALTFRIGDNWNLLSVGTHFLWHIFGAVAAFCMFQYIYFVNENNVPLKKS
ncbi:hypothetical protein [Flavobacterium sp. NRK1]|uniref:hypothetical protein n=1 Tax=Flavobacterium sp. NRK1 TaxID=2954929 RepID=UPI002093D3DC|nr:hypothetical protein [Flavobacterium sp. NRK1]MCO6149138.1 hypothetical protein [Flavobacterium sp. NRK1]